MIECISIYFAKSYSHGKINQVEQILMITTLPALNIQIRQDLETINCPQPRWFPKDEKVLDVAIIGGGMAGSSVALALKMEGITHIKIFERNAHGKEGPWNSYARMHILRSGKHLVGPALDIPNLTLRAWYTAQYGEEAWKKLGNPPTKMWAEYLSWFRDRLDVPVEQPSTVTSIVPEGEKLKLIYTKDGKSDSVLCRKVVLATGRDGFGGPNIPAILQSLPKKFWAHTVDPIDFTSLKNKKIAVIGAGPSAFDAAATALEHGARKVDMLIRKPEIETTTNIIPFLTPGFFNGFRLLSEEKQFEIVVKGLEGPHAVPADSIKRIQGYTNLTLTFEASILKIVSQSNKVFLTTEKNKKDYDYVIAATGFIAEAGKVKELDAFAHNIQLWSDRNIQFCESPKKEALKRFPYLASNMAFTEKVPGLTPTLNNIHCFNYGGFFSHYFLTGDIPGIHRGATRLAQAIAGDIFLEMYTKILYKTPVQMFDLNTFELRMSCDRGDDVRIGKNTAK